MSEEIGELYTIHHITLFTGLSDRTIRNYIRLGLLQGEKINGQWQFTLEQVEAFVRNPAVRPSILAKKNALVYDFLLDDKKRENQMCVILDLPEADPKETADFFCYEISAPGKYRDLRFSFDSGGGMPRIILKGSPDQIMELVQRYDHR